MIAKFFLFVAGWMAIQMVNCQSTETIRIKGSDTCLPLIHSTSSSYKTHHPEINFEIDAGGTGLGISNLLDGKCDIAMASREIDQIEKDTYKAKAKKYKEHKIAMDAVALIVHPTNPVNKLTKEQICDIFTGKIKNWKELGGNDLRIVIYSREKSSGTFNYINEYFLNTKIFYGAAINLPNNDEIAASVAQTNGGIGYISMSHGRNDIKYLELSFDGGKTFYHPELSKNKNYKLIRPLYLYTLTNKNLTLNKFISYSKSKEAYPIMKEAKFIPLKQ